MRNSTFSSVFNQAYAKLNSAQKVAVDTIEGPVMVVAGPGTGKTQVLALRIANILQKTDTPPYAILALTFTESGARSMRERLVSMIGPDGYYVTIGTFHGFCSGILREHPDRFALSEEAEPLTDLERIGIFSEILDKEEFTLLKPLGKPHLYVKSLIRVIQDLKREGYTAGRFKDFLDTLPEPTEVGKKKIADAERQVGKLQEVSRVFALYEQKLQEVERYDYEDMINMAIEAFRHDEQLLRQYQERFLYILTDEYQDTNSAQNAILFQLASFWGEQANIFVVGDPDQSIYRFQGASLENILAFKKHFPDAKGVYLNHNYRSQQTVLDSAHALIQKNALRSSDIVPEVTNESLRSQTEHVAEHICVAHFSNSTIENAFIGERIKKMLDEGIDPGEIVVLYRDNADANDIADMLSRMGVPYNLEGGDNVLHTGDVVRLLTMMRAVVSLRNQTEELELFTLLNYDFLEIEPLDVLKLSRFASEQKLHFLEAINDPRLDTVGLTRKEKITDTVEKLGKWGKMDGDVSLVELFETILNDSGLLDWVLSQSDAVRRLNRLNSFFKQVKNLNKADHVLTLKTFLNQIDLMEKHGISVQEEDLDISAQAIRLSTAHRIKGQEYEHVFISKAIDGKWGNRRVTELIKLPESLVSLVDISKKEKNEDERRLFYVALTRAKKSCWITWSDAYEDKNATQSMFVEEIPESMKMVIDTSEFQKNAKKILESVFTQVQQPEISPAEANFLRRVLADYKMNPTALNTYDECAYKFKLNQLLRTPRAKSPSLAYGTAMHRALEEFFGLYRQMQSMPSLDYLQQRFAHAIDKEILTAREKSEWKRRGEEALSLYVSFYKNELRAPIATERFFGSSFHPVYLDDVGLTGKVDKVEWVDETAKAVRVVDYKTGTPKSRNEIEGKTKYSDGSYKRQLVFYQLLAELDRTFQYKVVEAQLDFVEKMSSGKLKRETFSITKEDVEKLKQEIKETMKKIRNLEFPRTTNYSVCALCDFRRHCWPEGIPSKQSSQGEQLELL